MLYPLLLLENNAILGNASKPGEIIKLNDRTISTEPLFEPFPVRVGEESYSNGIVPLEISFFDTADKTMKTGIVTLKFSIVKEKFYDKNAISDRKNPGSTDMGDYVEKLEGISVVRAGREIDFGTFDFYSDKNNPYHRGWGCEINFEPELDEVFKVANNKQHVELIEVDDIDYEEDVKPVWCNSKEL